MAVSLTQPPALPFTTPIVTVHRRRLIPWVLRFGLLVLGFAILAVVLPGDPKLVVYAIGSLVTFLAIVFLFAAYLAAGSFDRSLTSVEREPWVHWRYTPDQWAAWGDAEVGRLAATPSSWVWRRDWKHFLTSVAVLAAIVFAFDSRSVPWQWNATVVISAGFAMFLVIAISQRIAKTAPYRLRRLLTNAVPESFFGEAGVYADGLFTQWQTLSSYLVDASLDERSPRSLSFLFNKHAMTTADPIAYITGTGTSIIAVHQNVLIPPDADAEIAVLQTKVAAICPRAHVAFNTSSQTGDF